MADGTIHWVRDSISATPDENEKGRISLNGILTDITRHKKAEQALHQERDLLHTLMDNLPDCIFFKDEQSDSCA